MDLTVVSPEGIIFEDKVDEVSLPTPQGEISILPNHVSLFSSVSDGIVVIKKNEKQTLIATIGGFVEVKNNSVTVLSDYIVKADSIEVAKAQEAKKRAEEAMKKKESDVDFILAEKELQKSIMELHVAHKMKKKQRY